MYISHTHVYTHTHTHFIQEETDQNEDLGLLTANPMFFSLCCLFQKSAKTAPLPGPLIGPLSTQLSRLAVPCRSVQQHGISHLLPPEKCPAISEIQWRTDDQVFTSRVQLYSIPQICRVHLCDKSRDCQVSAVGVTIRNSIGRNPVGRNSNFLILVAEKIVPSWRGNT